jgi:hypothetical protein
MWFNLHETVFMQKQNILDGVVILHEAVHKLHTKKFKWGNSEIKFWKNL